MMKIICLLLAVSVARSALSVYSLKQELIQENVRTKAWASIKNSLKNKKYSDADFKVSEKSGAFFYTQENYLSSWKMTDFGYDSLDVSLLQKNNGTVRVEMKEVSVKLTSDYKSNVWVDWLKNSSGVVDFDVISDMTFDFALSLEDSKITVTSQTMGGLKLRQDQVKASVSDNEELADSLALMFSKMGAPALLSIRKRVETLVDAALTTYLKSVDTKTVYPFSGNY